MWDAADAYDRFMGRWSRPLAAAVVEVALKRGAGTRRWLEVGGGTGHVTAAALDAGVGHVDTVEPSPAFADALDRRFAGRPVTVHRTGAPDLPEGTWDAAVSSLVLNFTPDPVATLTAMSARLAPGGTGVVSVWDITDPRSFLWRFWAAVADLQGQPAPADERSRFPTATPAGLSDAATAAGWDPHPTIVDVPTPFTDADDLWEPFLLGAGPVGGWVAARSDDERRAIRDRLVQDILVDGPPAAFRAMIITTTATG